ncbi:hypothetical protein K438DRAFT_357589 [Mycena galopus ATCC 62051]|nr:hypothetical protein K438DRAFT_357589 [Mycena galopus ATCC 62051]
MESDTVVDNLTYLSKYLEESGARVRELENELANLRRVKTDPDIATRLSQLESEKADLRTQVSSLQDQLKAKHENLNTVAVKKENDDNMGSVASLTEKYEEECSLREALQAKYTELQVQLKDTAELAAKTLRERLEAEKALQAARQTCADLQATNSVLVAEENASGERHTAAITRLKGKNDKLKEEKTGLQGSAAEQGTRILSLTHKLSRVKAKYQAVNSDKEELQQENAELQQTLREMIDLVESLQEDVKENANADLVKMVESLSKQCSNAEEARSQLQEKCSSLEGSIAKLEKDKPQTRKFKEALAKYENYMHDLPFPENPPPFGPLKLDPVCSSHHNLHGFIAQNPSTQRFLNHVLHLPRRLVPLSSFNYLAYGPTSRYDRTTNTWSEGSDLIGVHGGTRELFVNTTKLTVYVGTYKCHDLRPLHPGGTSYAAHISSGEIVDAALGVPRPHGDADIIRQRYPDGTITVEATGLQCIGFNTELYDSLRQRFAEEGLKGKRKAGSEDLRDGGKRSKK